MGSSSLVGGSRTLQPLSRGSCRTHLCSDLGGAAVSSCAQRPELVGVFPEIAGGTYSAEGHLHQGRIPFTLNRGSCCPATKN